MKSKKTLYKKYKQSINLILALIFGLTFGAWLFGGETSKTMSRDSINTNIDTGHIEHQLWTCAMHPQIKQEAPGQCPICGMDLIPLKEDSQTNEMDTNAIMLSDAAIKLAEVQTYTVQKAIPNAKIELSGIIETDPRQRVNITARYGGRIEKLLANFTGQYVSKGQKIAEIYAPDLLIAQQELWDAAKHKKINPVLYHSAREKLKLWELTDRQIDVLEHSQKPAIRFPVLSPFSGYIKKLLIAEGDYVKEGQALLSLVSLNQVWIMLDAYEPDLSLIKTGNKVNFRLHAIPGKVFQGKITYIDPFVNRQTRVAKVRVIAKNQAQLLKPGMFVSANIVNQLSGKKILIPKSAVLWTGKRSVVYVKKANTFIYREIILGSEAGNYYIVNEGLKAGEEIVSHAVFKVDAAAQLLGKPSMMNAQGRKINIMSGMDMTD